MGVLYGLVERLFPHLVARFSPRLSLEYLQMTTESIFDSTASSPEFIRPFQALKDSDPTVDHSTRWRDQFQHTLQRIASRATRKTQAQECRKVILETFERWAIAGKLLKTPTADLSVELARSFLPQLTNQGTPLTNKVVAQVWMYYTADALALQYLYRLQFDSTVSLEKFEQPYRLMCEAEADFLVNRSLISAKWPGAAAKKYLDHNWSRLEEQLASIKREFKENLYDLSPAPPDARRLVEWSTSWSKQHDAMQQATKQAADIEAAYEKGDYATALNHYRLLADQGNAQAQFSLATMYHEGLGVTQDKVEAAKWLRLAADQGIAEAQCNLGLMYDRGVGVIQNDREAVKWYRLAADQGIAQAQSNLGVMYDSGRGVTKNDEEAAKWYRLAANQGSAEAQWNLSRMYIEGRGVAQDDGEAVKWLHLAADQGFAQAQCNLGVMYQMGRGVVQNDVRAYMYYALAVGGLSGVEQDQALENRDMISAKMAPEQVAEAQLLVERFTMEQLFNDGKAAYKKGDYATALNHYRLLADQGEPASQYNLALMYQNGLGVPQDYVQARQWYEKAAVQGYAGAQVGLGWMYNTGNGGPQNDVEALKWYDLAAANGEKLGAENRDDLAKRMTPAQIAEAQQLAREWIPKTSW